MDIQGAEYEAVPCSLRALTEKVKMVCIRTHWKPSDEQGLEALFREAGWQEACVLYNKTPMQIEGEHQPLIDGLQCWVNTNLRVPTSVSLTH